MKGARKRASNTFMKIILRMLCDIIWYAVYISSKKIDVKWVNKHNKTKQNIVNLIKNVVVDICILNKGDADEILCRENVAMCMCIHGSVPFFNESSTRSIFLMHDSRSFVKNATFHRFSATTEGDKMLLPSNYGVPIVWKWLQRFEWQLNPSLIFIISLILHLCMPLNAKNFHTSRSWVRFKSLAFMRFVCYFNWCLIS